MNRYLLGSLLGGLALMAMFGAGVTDWLTGLAAGDTAGVRIAQQSNNTTNDTTSPNSVEKAGRLVQRQSEPVSAANQPAPNQNGTANGQPIPSASNNTTNTANSTTAQGQGTTNNTANTGTGSTSGTSGTASSTAAQGTPAPANLESIPALW